MAGAGRVHVWAYLDELAAWKRVTRRETPLPPKLSTQSSIRVRRPGDPGGEGAKKAFAPGLVRSDRNAQDSSRREQAKRLSAKIQRENSSTRSSPVLLLGRVVQEACGRVRQTRPAGESVAGERPGTTAGERAELLGPWKRGAVSMQGEQSIRRGRGMGARIAPLAARSAPVRRGSART